MKNSPLASFRYRFKKTFSLPKDIRSLSKFHLRIKSVLFSPVFIMFIRRLNWSRLTSLIQNRFAVFKKPAKKISVFSTQSEFRKRSILRFLPLKQTYFRQRNIRQRSLQFALLISALTVSPLDAGSSRTKKVSTISTDESKKEAVFQNWSSEKRSPEENTREKIVEQKLEDKGQKLAFRRIYELTRIGDIDAALAQSKDFVEKWPESNYAQEVHLLMGQLYSLKGKSAQAALSYRQIKDPLLLIKSTEDMLEVLKDEGNWKEIIDFCRFTRSLPAHSQETASYVQLMELYAEGTLALESNDKRKKERALENIISLIEDKHTDFTDDLARLNVRLALDLLTQVHGENLELWLHAQNKKEYGSEKENGALWQYFLALFALDRQEAALAKDLFTAGLQKGNEEWPLYMQQWSIIELFEFWHAKQQADEIISHVSLLDALASNEKKAQLLFIAASSLSGAGELQSALSYWRQFVDETQESRFKFYAQRYFALENLMALSFQAQDIAGLDRAIELFSKEYRSEEGLFRALFLKAGLLAQAGKYEESLRDYTRILAQKPDFEMAAQCLLQAGFLEIELQKWEHAWSHIDQYLRRENERQEAWPAFLQVNAQLIDHEQSKMLNRSRLERVMQRLNEDLSIEQDLKKQWIANQALDQLRRQRVEQALTWLDLAKIASMGRLLSPMSQGVWNIAKVLRDPKQELKGPWIREMLESENEEFTRKFFAQAVEVFKYYERFDEAREMMWYQFESSPEDFAKEDAFWLAQQFSQVFDAGKSVISSILMDPLFDVSWQLNELKLSDKQRQFVDRAQRLLAYSFQDQEIEKALSDGPSSALEAQIFQLGRLNLLLGNYARAQELFSNLRQYYMAKPQENWQLVAPTHLYLAVTKELSGPGSDAFGAYDELLDQLRSEPVDLWGGIQLHTARLGYQNLSQDLREKINPRLSEVLKMLQTLADLKSIDTEPIHLEAAIEHAIISARVYSADMEKKTLLKNLRHVRQQFSQLTDIASREYYSQAKAEHVNSKFYHSYILLIDAMIAQLEFELSDSIGERSKDVKATLARSLYKGLLDPQYALSPFIVDYANQGLEALRNKEQGL